MADTSDDFERLEFTDAPQGRIRTEFLASRPKERPRALLVYLHAHGERVENPENKPGRSSLRNNAHLIPNVLENDGETATFVRERFIVVVPHAFLDPGGWDGAGLWRSLKTFYGPQVGQSLSGVIYVSGVSMGGTGTWKLACEIVDDQDPPFRLEALAAVDVHESVSALLQSRENLRNVRALGMRTSHRVRTPRATMEALEAVGQGNRFIDRTVPAAFSQAWGSLYSCRNFYEWLLNPAAPLPALP